MIAALTSAIRTAKRARRAAAVERELAKHARCDWFSALNARHNIDVGGGRRMAATPLELCMYVGSPDCMRLLCEWGADPMGAPGEPWPGRFCEPYSCAHARAMQPACIRVLIDRCGGRMGSERDTDAACGALALFAWCRTGASECVRMLLRHGCVPDDACFVVAISRGYQSVVDELLRAGFRPGPAVLRAARAATDDVASCVKQIVPFMRADALRGFILMCAERNMAAAARYAIRYVSSSMRDQTWPAEDAMEIAVRSHAVNFVYMLIAEMDSAPAHEDALRKALRQSIELRDFEIAGMLIDRGAVLDPAVLADKDAAEFVEYILLDRSTTWGQLAAGAGAVREARGLRGTRAKAEREAMEAVRARNPIELHKAILRAPDLTTAFVKQLCMMCIEYDAAECMYFLTRNDSYAEKLMREDISGRTRDTIIESMFIRGAFACCMRAIRTFGINKNTMEMLVAASICALSSELIRLLFDAGVTTSITFRPKGRRDGPSMRPIDVAASIRAEECLIVLCGQRDAMRAEHVPSLLMSVCTYSDGGALDAFAGSTSMSQAPLANQRAARCIAIALAAIQHPDEIAANQMHLDAALIATVQEIDTASVRQLLRFGANPARFMGESCSAAILACRVDNSEALFEMNQSHDIRSSISWRIQALIESARTASSECVRFLVSTETIDHSDIGDDELVQSSVGIE